MDQDALNGWKSSQDGLNGDGSGDLCNLNNNNSGSNSADNNNCQIQKAVHHQTTSLSALAHYLPKKLQVTEKDGLFIALDNNSLKLMRHLERTGRCSEVEVEIVPLSKVPPNIVQEIFTNHHQQHCGMTSGATTRSNSTHAYSNHNHQNKHRKQCHNCRRCCSSHHFTSSNHCNRKNGATGQCCGSRANETHPSGNDIELKPLVDSLHNKAHKKLFSKPEGGYHNHVLLPKDEDHQWSTTVTTITTSTKATNSSASNNTYLSDQQLRSARLSNTMTVMAPCLRQPITTSAPASDLSMRNFKWNNCCNERISANQKMTKLLTSNEYEELDIQEDGNSGNCDENDENQLPHVQIHKPNSQCLLASKLGFNRSKASTANDTTAAVTNHNHGYTKLSANQFDSHTPDGCITSNGSNCCSCLRLMGDSIIRKKHQDSSAQCMHSTNGSACHHSSHHVHHSAQLHCSNQCAKFKCIHQQLKTSNYLNKNNNQDLEGGHCYGNGEQLSCDEDEDEEENNDDNEDNEDEDEDCEDEEDTDDNENDEDEDDVSSDEDEDEDKEDNFNSNCHGNHFHSLRSFDNSVCSNEDEDDAHQEICNSEGDEEDVDEDDIDSMCELFVCNVCDRSYKTARNMAKHQVRRRHFGCSICDTVFPTLYSLEQHKESLEHWSDDESALDMSFLECTEHSHDRHSHHSYKKCDDDIEANGETMIALNTFSNHGYPSVASNHLKNSRNNNSDQQTKLSLKDTTVAGMLAKSNGKGIPNGFTGGNINGTLKLQTHKSSHHQHSHNHNFLYKTNEIHGNNQAKVSTPTSNNSQKVIFSSSLSSKLMASVFNFYSSTSLSSTGSNGSLVKSANRLDFASNTHQEDMKRLV